VRFFVFAGHDDIEAVGRDTSEQFTAFEARYEHELTTVLDRQTWNIFYQV